MLGNVLKLADIRRDARYIVFRCADLIGGKPYYESIDLIDAFHPQTILAWGMNDAPLTIPHGAPVRLRVERQLGYKPAQYVKGKIGRAACRERVCPSVEVWGDAVALKKKQ